ncbi:MAG: hypothetical protein DRJ03_06455 [Chloroflexi bacterium]|nr:MAG: hypothetical protein DRJ03_06455 [Chloroflexota bacterium]
MKTEIIEAKPAGKEPPTPAPKKVKVLIKKASNIEYEEVLERANWDQIMQELFRRFGSWVVEPIWGCYKEKYPDAEYLCTMYDDYLE